jgi:hypothetical protein
MTRRDLHRDYPENGASRLSALRPVLLGAGPRHPEDNDLAAVGPYPSEVEPVFGLQDE